MASFTDIIPKFNPYIQQLPVEAMVQVGMEKQKRYDEGIQKIQSEIDNIAGMDIVKDVHRQYLQSKLNELGNNLRTVAAGDFSNFQLVNSVSGMAKQVGKDPIVSNAVQWSAKYRKEVANMEAAKKDGKSAIQNEWDFNSRAANWLNSKNLNDPFVESYTPYTDYQKKWFDVVKSLHSDLTEQDIPYVRNPDGTIDYSKTAAAMQRISKETVSANKIENALRATLTPAELNQLSIDGRYQFRGVTNPEDLTRYATAKYTSQVSENDKMIAGFEEVARLSSSDPVKLKNAKDSIEALKQNNQRLKEKMNEEMDYIRKNPEDAKATIYRNGAIEQFASGFSWEHNKSNLLANPVLEAEHWERSFALDQSKYALSVRAQNWKEYKDKFDIDMANKDYKLKVDKLLADLYGIKGEFITYTGESTKVKDPRSAMETDIFDLRKDADNSVQKMAKSLNISVGAIEQAIIDYNSGDSKRVESAKNKIPIEWRDEVAGILEQRRKAAILDNGLKKIRSDVEQSDKFKDASATLSATLRSLPTITVGNQTFTQQEITNYLAKEGSYEEAGEGGGTVITMDKNKLTPKERVLFEAVRSRYSWEMYAPGQPKFSREGASKINAVFDKYRKADNQVANVNSQIDKEVSRVLLERSGRYIPTLRSITFSSEGGQIARRTWESITSNALLKYDKDIGGIKGGAEQLSRREISKVRDWLGSKDKDDIIYKTLTQGNKTYLVLVKGRDEVIVPLEKYEADQLPLTDKDSPSEQYQNIVEAQYLGNGNTNVTGNYEDAYFGRYDFPNVRTLSVKGDVKWNQSNTAKQYMMLRLNTPAGVMPLQLDDYPVTREDAVKFFNSLTDTEVKKLYLNDPRVSDSWKEVIRGL
jgi:hypothetical protein